MPDKNIVEEAFKVEVNSMEFKQNERNDWDRVSKDFVYHIDENKKIRNFVRGIKSAKLEQERTMRQELDLRLMSIKVSDREF